MIEVQGLSKHFGSILAVDNLSFTVNPGEVLGFLGPNGAGKSTTMKMITGFLRPDAGSARICGYDISEQALQAKKCFGYLPEGAPGYADMTVYEFLEFIADLRGLQAGQKKQRLQAVTEEIHLASVLNQKIDTLSKGFRRRVGLAQAVLHDPQVLILDEPTDGLDPNQKHEVRKLIRGMAKDKIIVVSTHILEEVEAVCTRAMIIAKGRLLEDATPEDLIARSRSHGAVAIKMQHTDADIAQLKSLAGIASVDVSETGEIILIAKTNAQLLPAVTAMIKKNAWQIESIFQKRGKLDEVFREITGGATA